MKDHYQRKATEAKHQHQLANPDYHYQPRKPFEKKKRMTKSKLAKLATKNAAGKNHTTAVKGQANQFATMTEQMELPVFNTGPTLDTTSKPGYMSITGVAGPTAAFRDELNALHEANRAVHAVNPSAAARAFSATRTIVPTSDGLNVAQIESFPVDLSGIDPDLYGDGVLNLGHELDIPAVDYRVVQAPAESLESALDLSQFDSFCAMDTEIFRHEKLDDLFDFDSFSYDSSSLQTSNGSLT